MSQVTSDVVALAAPPIEYPPISAAARACGWCTIIGFGSLLSARSAGMTFKELRGFRGGVLKGYRRVFAHVAAIFIERGIANVDTKEMSSLSVEPSDDPSASLLVSVFEIPVSALPAFFERETEFRWLHAPVYSFEDASTLDPLAVNGEGLLCAAYSDEEYRRVRLGGSEAAFQQAYGRWGVQRVWRDDLLPCPVYLRHVVLAAAAMDRFLATQTGGETERLVWGQPTSEATTAPHATAVAAASACSSSAPSTSSSPTLLLLVTSTGVSLPAGRVLSSFLDGTFLGDRRTTIRHYLQQHPHVMLAQPPSHLAERYSG